MDNVFRKLCAQGISADNKPTEASSIDEIEQLWACRSLCCDTPKLETGAMFSYSIYILVKFLRKLLNMTFFIFN